MQGLLGRTAMRLTKLAIAAAFAADGAVSNLVPRSQVFSVERATVPVLPSIEVIGLSSERVDSGPMIRHELSCEITVSHATEDGADTLRSMTSYEPHGDAYWTRMSGWSRSSYRTAGWLCANYKARGGAYPQAARLALFAARQSRCPLWRRNDRYRNMGPTNR